MAINYCSSYELTDPLFDDHLYVQISIWSIKHLVNNTAQLLTLLYQNFSYKYLNKLLAEKYWKYLAGLLEFWKC